MSDRRERGRKVYAVWQGRRTGVFDTWQEAKAQVEGYPSPGFAAFLTRKEAERELERRLRLQAPAGPRPDEGIAVDAACSGAVGPVEYRGVDLRTGEVVFAEGPIEGGTNNIGEFLAIVRALEVMEERDIPGPVWSESDVAIDWVMEGRHRSSLKPTDENRDLRRRICQAECWLVDGPDPLPVDRWRSDAWGAVPVDFAVGV